MNKIIFLKFNKILSFYRERYKQKDFFEFLKEKYGFLECNGYLTNLNGIVINNKGRLIPNLIKAKMIDTNTITNKKYSFDIESPLKTNNFLYIKKIYLKFNGEKFIYFKNAKCVYLSELPEQLKKVVNAKDIEFIKSFNNSSFIIKTNTKEFVYYKKKLIELKNKNINIYNAILKGSFLIDNNYAYKLLENQKRMLVLNYHNASTADYILGYENNRFIEFKLDLEINNLYNFEMIVDKKIGVIKKAIDKKISILIYQGKCFLFDSDIFFKLSTENKKKYVYKNFDKIKHKHKMLMLKYVL